MSFPLHWDASVTFSKERSKQHPEASSGGRDVALTASLWPIDSKVSEEDDSVQGGSVLCELHLDIDF